MITRSKDKYKQVRVTSTTALAKKMNQRPIPKPDLEVGALAKCTFKSLFFTIDSEAPIIDLVQDDRFVSRWRVTVADTKGKEHQLDSRYFDKPRKA